MPTGIQEVITEAGVGLEQVSLDASGRLHCHLGAVLQDVHRELGARHTGQPQPEVTVHLKQVDSNVLLPEVNIIVDSRLHD